VKNENPTSTIISHINFRPNILIENVDPHEEDNWKEILIGENKFYVAVRCTRCLLPNVNPETGEAVCIHLIGRTCTFSNFPYRAT